MKYGISPFELNSLFDKLKDFYNQEIEGDSEILPLRRASVLPLDNCN